MWAWLTSYRCFPLHVVNLKLLNDARGPGLTNGTSLPSAYLELSAFWQLQSLNQDNYLTNCEQNFL